MDFLNRGISNITFAKLGSVKNVSCGLRAPRYIGPKIWNIVPLNIKNLATLEQFKVKINSSKPTHCPCYLCHP